MTNLKERTSRAHPGGAKRAHAALGRGVKTPTTRTAGSLFRFGGCHVRFEAFPSEGRGAGGLGR